MANINFNPSSGSGNKAVSVSGNCNPGIDKLEEYAVATNDGRVSKRITVTQEGKREEFYVKNGNQYEPFLLSNGDSFAVVKDKFKDNPNC